MRPSGGILQMNIHHMLQVRKSSSPFTNKNVERIATPVKFGEPDQQSILGPRQVHQLTAKATQYI